MNKNFIKDLEITISDFLQSKYSKSELLIIEKEIRALLGDRTMHLSDSSNQLTYEKLQEMLGTMNENEKIRRANGVYYTPVDVVKFIVYNSFKMSTGRLKPNNIHVIDLNGIAYRNLCFEKEVFDPTCGAGEFLLAALELKLDLVDLHYSIVTKSNIFRVLATIKGNDINSESTTISKLRLLLCILQRYGINSIIGISHILNGSFQNKDYVSKRPSVSKKYDIIVGNPPYVEDSKSGLQPNMQYGNIYANVLENAARQLKASGVMAFVIPLSYTSTPRMKKIRDVLYSEVPEQFILSYADRPDSLFKSVHQKLNIFFAKKVESKSTIYTGNYTYWYKDERNQLFNTSSMIKNEYITDKFIPKIGNDFDLNVYRKVDSQKTSLLELVEFGDESVYLNMRATFWIKAFRKEHKGSEYKELKVRDRNTANFIFCLLNSSIFWWFWICISDCWHITNKELTHFKIPEEVDEIKVNRLAKKLEIKLEETKEYIGTKQTIYAYKHKLCVNEIHEIDDYINGLFGLTNEESLYIKNFGYTYRIGGGNN